MKLQTIIPLKKSNNPINYDSKVLLMGSCFSENIGNKLSYFKFQSFQNPFGILFNPIAIENLISKSVSDYQYNEDDVFFLNERWHCFDAHSALSSRSKDELISRLNEALTTTRGWLQQTTHIIITLGTSWAYQHNEKDSIVANCHKVPQQAFTKKLLGVQEVEASILNITQLVGGVNPDCQVIFTVSPVRHLKDGFRENTLSKSHLIAGLNQERSTSLDYFPSYEIMMDELRDYRFYSEDMIHPNLLAIDYIWEKFKHVWIDENASQIMKKVGNIQKGLAHRSFNVDSQASMNFKKKLQTDIDNLIDQYPHMRF